MADEERPTFAQSLGVADARVCTEIDERLNADGGPFKPIVDFDPKDPELPCRRIVWALGGSRFDLNAQGSIPLKRCLTQKAAACCPRIIQLLTPKDAEAIQYFINSRNQG